MKTRFIFAAFAAAAILTGCNSRGTVAEEISDDGLLLNDELVAVRTDDGKVSIKNATTGKVTIKDIKLDWTAPSRNDSLAVFCSENKRGYYNMYTGEIAIPAQYRRAWVFSEGMAAVQKNGNVGFINRKGDTALWPTLLADAVLLTGKANGSLVLSMITLAPIRNTPL